MEQTKQNDSALPIIDEAAGLTKREYFAAQAMAGILANYNSNNAAYAAKQAVEHADALIAALNK